MKRTAAAVMAAVLLLFTAGCGKENKGNSNADSGGVRYDIVDGQIIVSGEAAGTGDAADDSDNSSYTAAEAGSMTSSAVSEGVSYTAEAYNSLSSDASGLIDALKVRLQSACDVCRGVYLAADKGDTMNITLSRADIASMMEAVSTTGYACADSAGEMNMYNYSSMSGFGEMVNASRDDVSVTYFVIYPDGHLSGFLLSREMNAWHLYSASAAWNEDGSTRIYSEGRYAVGSVRYTDKGWLIYSRDTSDFDENQKANTDAYVMLRCLPYDSTKKTLCERYIEPVGYLENNLFTTNWSEADMGPIDFNSLYAYLFGMYNGTQMLSSYNVRNYYKAVQGTRLYLVPTETFETAVCRYFNIDRAALKNISDYSSSLGGYFFLGYDRDYYNVTPRTPSPEVVSYTENSNGSITMTVDAVNRWYGTDRAFRHEVTVMPLADGGFRYVSNRLIEDENNIIPQQKLSEMLNVELTKTTFG